GLTIIDDLTTVTPVLGTAKGAYGQGIDGSEMLFMNPRFTQAEQVPTMIHELAHAKLHSKTSNSNYSSSVKEFQAELAAYIV
ncbi:ImmA/IrrE family metallo-endopeptidase, partial [Enterococcus casseliflavus]